MPAYANNPKANHVATAVHNAITGSRSGVTGSAHMALIVARALVTPISNVHTVDTVADFIEKRGPYAKGQPTKDQPISGNDLKDWIVSHSLKGATNANEFEELKTRESQHGETIATLAKDHTSKGRAKLQKARQDQDLDRKAVAAVRQMAVRALHAAREIVRANGTEDWTNVTTDVTSMMISDRGSVLVPLGKRGEFLAVSMNRLVALGRMTDKDRREWLDSHDIETGEPHQKGTREKLSDREVLAQKAGKVAKDVKRTIVHNGQGRVGDYAFGMLRVLDNVSDIKRANDEDQDHNVIADLHAVADRIAELLSDVDIDQYITTDDETGASDDDAPATGTDG